MPRFYSIVENGEYGIGCTGQTVWVWDKYGTVLAKFKDLIYAYNAMFSPLGDIFVVKSTEGRLAVYSLKTLSLIKKFRFSKINYGQDDGFCFSPDGRFFYNVERREDWLLSAISVYDTSDFSLRSTVLFDENIMLSHIQEGGGEYYVLGYLRKSSGEIDYNVVAKFTDGEIKDIRKISEREEEFYDTHLWQTVFGARLNDSQKIGKVHTLKDLWERSV